MKQRFSFMLALGVFAAWPSQALANSGTPLMWAGMLHLVIGNALIGLFEAVLLARIYKVSRLKVTGTMILANYLSAWMGELFLRGFILDSLPMDLNNGWMWFWIMVPVTFVITLALEWPFIAWSLRGTVGWLKKSLWASIVVQGCSYAIIFGWYWLASATSLYTRTQVVNPAELSLPEYVLVYYIDSSDGDVYRRSLALEHGEKIWDLNSTNWSDRLFTRPAIHGSNLWDLVARIETPDDRTGNLVTIASNLAVKAAVDWRSTYTDPPQYPNTWFNFGKVPAIGSAKESAWQFRTGFWPVEGLQSQEGDGKPFRLAYETPFGRWVVRNAVQIPDDRVLFQLGHDQICAFDPVHRRVALLWRGRGPVAIIEEPEARRQNESALPGESSAVQK